MRQHLTALQQLSMHEVDYRKSGVHAGLLEVATLPALLVTLYMHNCHTHAGMHRAFAVASHFGWSSLCHGGTVVWCFQDWDLQGDSWRVDLRPLVANASHLTRLSTSIMPRVRFLPAHQPLACSCGTACI